MYSCWAAESYMWGAPRGAPRRAVSTALARAAPRTPRRGARLLTRAAIRRTCAPLQCQRIARRLRGPHAGHGHAHRARRLLPGLRRAARLEIRCVCAVWRPAALARDACASQSAPMRPASATRSAASSWKRRASTPSSPATFDTAPHLLLLANRLQGLPAHSIEPPSSTNRPSPFFPLPPPHARTRAVGCCFC